ncbi:cytochrome b/b6 domain-containing protein [Methylosinus sp. Ce-a6]|uniref:cytochrome b/b6 domain-containing protein n=1 Tax=Methylosinus sp. Ce-a6 TaxID=2172005 RepID=UPI0013595D82|nr:cytochrome b/b6 domain-containing protein [Methylosinus sp. Ce-a6]
MTVIDRPPVTEAATTQSKEKRLVWDLPVRLFHWSLVVSFVGAYVTNRLGVAWFDWHVRFGYAVLALVLFRILWGVFGAEHARFSSFLRHPREAWLYARRLLRGEAPRYAGHNPLGAIMVVALLLGLSSQAIMGLFANDEIFNAGPFAGAVSKEASLLLTSLHKRGFYVLAAAVFVHIVAVIAYVTVKREDLLRAMVTGRKSAAAVHPKDEIASSRLPLAATLFVLVVVALAVLTSLVPVDAAGGDAF